VGNKSQNENNEQSNKKREVDQTLYPHEANVWTSQEKQKALIPRTIWQTMLFIA
jgi:hypothetical protein